MKYIHVKSQQNSTQRSNKRIKEKQLNQDNYIGVKGFFFLNSHKMGYSNSHLKLVLASYS